MTGRRVLFVSYRFPPQNTGGTIRVVKFAKYLARKGWIVDVIVPKGSDNSGFEKDLESKSIRLRWAQCPQPFDVCLNFLRKIRPRRAVSNTKGKASVGQVTHKKPLWLRVLWLLRFPDEATWWGKSLQREIDQYFSDYPDCEVIYVHGQPFSPMLAVLKRNHVWRRRLIFDFRDPWSLDPDYFYPFEFLRGCVSKMERRILASGHPILTVTESLAGDFKMLEPSCSTNIRVITNGFDAEDFAEAAPYSGTEQFVLSYAGTLYHRKTALFFAGLQMFLQRNSNARKVTRLLFRGPTEAECLKAASEFGVEDILQSLPPIPHFDWLQETAQVSVFLLFMSYADLDRIALPGKIFEYAALRRPILGFGWDGEAKQVIESCVWGRYFTEDDPRPIAKALEELYESWKKRTLVPFGEGRALDKFSRETLTGELERILLGN